MDKLLSVGGNYVRNTMSHRNAGNVFAYFRDEQGLFDLNRFNDEYWWRFENFLDISQNNAWSGLGQRHYDNIMYVRDYISDNPRPINNIKNYGAARHGEDESVARFCRMVFAGCAGVRFHRPHPIEDPNQKEASSDYGLGLSPLGQQVIQSMRWVMDEIEFAATKPRNDLLSEREENEAYLLAEPGKQYALYFPKGGEVSLDLIKARGLWEIRWRNVLDGSLLPEIQVEGNSEISVKTPGSGHWVAVVKPIKTK
jgi:hypothetical protein